MATFRRTPRQPLLEHDADLRTGQPAGAIKERLETKPEPGAHKKKMGDKWTPLRNVPFTADPSEADNNSINEGGINGPRIGLTLGRRHGQNGYGAFNPAMDDVNGEEHARAAALLGNDGFNHPVDPINDHGTFDNNEYFYEELEDPQTGNKGLTFRNKITGRP